MATSSGRHIPRAAAMIVPRHFGLNEQTAADNEFQARLPNAQLQEQARSEVQRAASKLAEHGVEILLFEDSSLDAPDAVFPNNWLSTHPGGELVIYPLRSAVRRKERRADIIEAIRDKYGVTRVIDFTSHEESGRYLEGTGSLVFSHDTSSVYAAISLRTDVELVALLADELRITPVVFHTRGPSGKPIYHTNVMMAVGCDLALIALDLIPEYQERNVVRESLEEAGKRIIELTAAQVSDFAGNCLELMGAAGPLVAMSSRGYGCLTPTQRRALTKSHEVLTVDFPTIELSGGSIRCALAALLVPPRSVGRG